MNVLVVLYSNDPETAWNAWRFANTCLGYDDEVTMFLMGKGVECMSLASVKYDIEEQIDIFDEFGGKLMGCGVCCDNREDSMPFLREELGCEMGSMQNFYTLVKAADKVISF
ncbi:MAG: DsrE family protein [Gammaproteobacteria bacterium]|nr:DsrE family protein [Gammaproteobacteria bacterium]